MLVLTRKRSEMIKIGDDIVVKIIQMGRKTVKIGIEAPQSVRVLRSELCPFDESAPLHESHVLHDSHEVNEPNPLPLNQLNSANTSNLVKTSNRAALSLAQILDQRRPLRETADFNQPTQVGSVATEIQSPSTPRTAPAALPPQPR